MLAGVLADVRRGSLHDVMLWLLQRERRLRGHRILRRLKLLWLAHELCMNRWLLWVPKGRLLWLLPLVWGVLVHLKCLVLWCWCWS